MLAVSSLVVDNATLVQEPSGATDALFNVRLVPPNIEQTVTVDFATIDGTATVVDGDYVQTAGILTFVPDETTMSVLVPVNRPTSIGPPKTFFLGLSNPVNADISTEQGQGVGLISTDLTAGTTQFASPTFSIEETAGTATVTVTRTGGTASNVGVHFATTDGTALAGVDYLPASGTLVFGVNQATATFTIPILVNPLAVGDKTINLVLSDPTGGGAIGDPASAVLTVVNVNPFVVTTVADSGPGSLRTAILAADANPGADAVSFDIPGQGAHTIRPTSPLPLVTDPILIDASTQPGFAGTPAVFIDGDGAGPLADGLTIVAGYSTVQGLGIVRFHGNGIVLQGYGANRLVGDFLGTDAPGSTGLGNGGDGILALGSPLNLIGGDGPGQGVVSSGNGINGVEVSGPGARGNVILGGVFGTNPDGDHALPNGFDGVYVNDAPDNRVGSASPSSRNILSGNGSVGLQITGDGATGNVIQGNLIGTDAAGDARIGNVSGGIYFEGAPGNTIGGDGAQFRNLVSGNAGAGIQLSGTGAAGNAILGNFIGTDATGTKPLGNAFDGIFAFNAPRNAIGGAAPGEGNLVSANGSVGIQLAGAGASGNLVLGNNVGTDGAGGSALGNVRDGIFLDGSPANVVGGPGSGARNLVSANGSVGIQVYTRAATGNVIEGNLIGTDASGAPRLGNNVGVYINQAPGNTVGGPTAATRNVNAGNHLANLLVSAGGGGPSFLGADLAQGGASIVLTFSTSLDPPRAQSLGNYRLKVAGRRGAVRLRSAQYDPVAQTVTLVPVQPLDGTLSYRLTIVGTSPGGLTDPRGFPLAGGTFTIPLGQAAASQVPTGPIAPRARIRPHR